MKKKINTATFGLTQKENALTKAGMGKKRENQTKPQKTKEETPRNQKST